MEDIMHVVKMLLAMLSIMVGLLFLWATIGLFGWLPPSSEFHVYKLRTDQIELIRNAAAHINDFRAKNAHVPSVSEFTEWMKFDRRYEGWDYSYQAPVPTNHYLTKVNGVPPQGSFVLSFWDGEGYVEYASWLGDGSLGYIHDSRTYRREVYWYMAFSTCFAVMFLGFSIFLLRNAVAVRRAQSLLRRM
ncbi:MAG: hypothetical protein ABL891_21435 [Burkholderiales bacterium]